jgi:phage RecT family recombinase
MDSGAEHQALALIEPAEAQFLATRDTTTLHWDDEKKFALALFERNPRLFECDPVTVRQSLEQVSSLGLSLNPVRQHATLIHRWNSKRKCNECFLMPQYRGLLALAARSTRIEKIECEVVSKSELERGMIEVTAGDTPRIKHTIDLMRDVTVWENIAGAYCRAFFQGSDKPVMTFMTRPELEKVRNSADSIKNEKTRDFSPWTRWPQEMCKKAVLKRAQKTWLEGEYVEATSTFAHAVELDNRIEHSEMTAPIEAQVVEATLSEQDTAELKKWIKRAGLQVTKWCREVGIPKPEALKPDELDGQLARLRKRALAVDIKNAEPGEVLFAADYELSIETMREVHERMKEERDCGHEVSVSDDDPPGD